MKLDLRRSVHLYFSMRQRPYDSLKRIGLWFSIVAFATTRLWAQDTTTWVRQFQQSTDAFTKATATQRMVGYYYETETYDPGIHWAAIGLPFARQCHDTLLWKHYDLLANLHDNAIHFDTSIHYMHLSLALKKKAGYWRGMANTYNDLGVVYGEKTELVKQATYYFEAKKIYDRIGDTTEGFLVATNIISNLFRQNKYQQTIDEYMKIMPQLHQRNHWGLLFNANSRMALSYAALKIPDSCFYYSRQEILTAHALNDTLWKAESWGRRAFLCGQLNNKKDFRTALDSTYYYGTLSGKYYNWGDYYFSLGMYATLVEKQYSLAIRHYYKSLGYVQAFSDKTAALSLLTKIAEAYQLTGNTDSAYQIMLQAFALKDSIITDDGRSKLAQMQVQYETEKKEATIQLLNKDNKLKQRTTYFLIGGVSLLALLLASVFRNNRRKQRTNQQLQSLNLALDKANQSKVRLFSILSHDLRSPVSSLYSYLQLKKIAPHLLNDEKKEEKENQLHQSAEQLLQTMEDLLIWSKSQLEKFTPQQSTVDLQHSVQQVLSIYQQAIDTKSIHVIVEGQNVVWQTDENILLTIVRNIISNAVRHASTNGIIKITIAPKEITIYNSGEPIDPVVAEQVFDWGHINSQSSGYGLKLAKELADKLSLVLYAQPQKEGSMFGIQQRQSFSQSN